MNWKGLIVPVISVVAFLGSLSFIFLIKISVKSFRKKILFSMLLIQMSVFGLTYLVPQFVFVTLYFLDIWALASESASYIVDYIKYLPRCCLLVMPLLLQIEMYVALQKQRFHSKINNIRFGILLNAGVTTVLAASTGFFVFGGVLKPYYFSLEGVSSKEIVTPSLEVVFAIMGLSMTIYFAFTSSSREIYAAQRKTKNSCLALVARFSTSIFLTFITVGSLRISIAVHHDSLAQVSFDIIDNIALFIDISGISLAPIILLRKTKTFKENQFNGLVQNECAIPKDTTVNPKRQNLGTIVPRDQPGNEVKLMTLKRKVSFGQKLFQEPSHSKQWILGSNMRKSQVRKFSFSSSGESLRKFMEPKPSRITSTSSYNDSDSLASRRSERRSLPQFLGIPENDFPSFVEDEKANDKQVLSQWSSVRIPGMVCTSVPSSPVAVQLQSFNSADWDKSFTTNSLIVTPHKAFDQTLQTRFVFPSIVNDRCWLDIVNQRCSGETIKSSISKSNSVHTLAVSPGSPPYEIAPNLRTDYIDVATGQKKGSGNSSNLPGFIPSPGPYSSRPRSYSHSGAYVIENPCFSLQEHENVVIAMLFDQ